MGNTWSPPTDQTRRKAPGTRVGPNEVIARDGFVRRIQSVATRKRIEAARARAERQVRP